MHIRIVALAGMLVFLQANAADPLIKLPKPADLEAATKGNAVASASAQAASAPAAAAASASASASASAPSASASAAASAPSASASVASISWSVPPASASASASAVASAAASAPVRSAQIAESVKKAASQTAAAPNKKAMSQDEQDDANIQGLAQRISERLAAHRMREKERMAQAAKRPKAKSVAHKQEAGAKSGDHAAHWDYEGEAGPAQWGKLNPAWSKCAIGERQSPIDIRDGMRLDLEKIQFDYRAVPFSVLNNGHTVQVTLGSGNRITVGGRSYELDQFHFHRPSEERINGKGFAMVAHLVHKDAEGRLAVVAALIEEGGANSLVQTVWNNLPLEKNDPARPAIQIDPAQLLPARRDYFTYMGSLTTPPCSEGVLWLVMKEPIQLSAAQIAIFSRLYPMNARPIQADSGRMIKESN